MKVSFFFFIMVALVGCNSERGINDLSTIDSLNIQGAIAVHNSSYGIKYLDDSIHKRIEILKAAYYLGKTRSEQFADSIMNERVKLHYQDYSPSIDPNLTFERFMLYCKERRLNPLSYIEQLNKK